MGSIYKDVSSVTVEFDRQFLTSDDLNILDWTINNFAYLIRLNEQLKFADFTRRISDTFGYSPRVQQCILVLEKAAIKNSYVISFTNEIGEEQCYKAMAESLISLESKISQNFGSVPNLTVNFKACCFRMGRMLFHSDNRVLV